jgi:hypothetical protein
MRAYGNARLLICAIVPFLLCAIVEAKMIIVPIQDIMMEIPNFTNAPSFNLNNGLFGGNPIGNVGASGRKTKKEREKELIDLLEAMYPEALSIRIYGGNVIIRLPDEEKKANN